MNEINLNIGARPTLEWVDVDHIDVDKNYQRDIKNGLVARILAKFSWRKFGAICLTLKPDGRYNVVEGQHRWTAAKLHPHITSVPAVIVDASSMASEAESFLAINRDRVAVTAIEQYWAGLAAGNVDDMAVAEVLKAAGCDVVPESGHYRPHLTNAVGALSRAIKRYGAGSTRRALLVLRAAWPNDNRALAGTIITALARIIRANGKTVSDDELARAIQSQTRAGLTAHAEGFRKLSGGSAETALTKAITELYNKGKRVNRIEIGAQA